MKAQQLEPRKPDEERIWKIKTSGGKGTPVEEYLCRRTGDGELTCFEYTEYPQFKEPRKEFTGAVHREVGKLFLGKWRQFDRLIMSDEVEGVDQTFTALEINFTFLSNVGDGDE
jgi:hypothetical protein